MHAGARCFYRLEDWWTYELCYQKHVRQFHREKDVLTAEYLLGVYHQGSADMDTLQVTSPDLPHIGRQMLQVHNGIFCKVLAYILQPCVALKVLSLLVPSLGLQC